MVVQPDPSTSDPHVELPELLEPPALPNLLQPLTLSPPPRLSCFTGMPQLITPVSQVRPQIDIAVKSQSTLERNRTGVVVHSRAVWPPGATGQGLHTSPACQAWDQPEVYVV